MAVEVGAPTSDLCSENAIWSAAEHVVWFTDINRVLVHRLDEDCASVRSWRFDEPVMGL